MSQTIGGRLGMAACGKVAASEWRLARWSNGGVERVAAVFVEEDGWAAREGSFS